MYPNNKLCFEETFLYFNVVMMYGILGFRFLNVSSNSIFHLDALLVYVHVSDAPIVRVNS